MKIKKLIVLLLTLIICISALPATMLYAASYNDGDTIFYGTYPSIKVEDQSLIDKLNSIDVEWESLGWYRGKWDSEHNQFTAVRDDYGKYKDVTLNGKKYRAVVFEYYRQYSTSDQLGFSVGSSKQKENGYERNTVYWFEYRPITWIVASAYDKLVVSQAVIDAQAYSSYVLESADQWYSDSEEQNTANNYYYASIRQWLNNDFYNTAFTDEQKANIDNSYSWGNSTSSPLMHDKIFLPQQKDVTSYYFKGDADKAIESRKCYWVSAYALASGAPNWGDTRATYPYYLQTPVSGSSASTYIVDEDGYADGIYLVNRVFGIRPAMHLKVLKDDYSQLTCDHSASRTTLEAMEASCSVEGKTEGEKCSRCGEILVAQKKVDKLSHTEVMKKENYTKGTCVKPSIYDEVYYCSVCNAELRRYQVSNMEDHQYVVKSTSIIEKATCTENGVKMSQITCKVCGADGESIYEPIDSLGGHKYATVITKATTRKNGEIAKKCSVCGENKTSPKLILKASNIEISFNKFTYNGKIQKPTLSVNDGMGNAIAPKYYSAEWSNSSSKNPGVYTIKIILKGNYSGTKTFRYYIYPLKVTGLKASAVKERSLVLTWSKVAGAKYYELQKSTNGKKWTTVTTTSSTSHTVSKLSAGTTYRFRVRANDSGKITPGEYSSSKSVTTLCQAPTITVTSDKAEQACVNITKVTGAKSYAIYLSTDGKNYKKVCTTSMTSYLHTRLTGGQTVYFKVAANNASGKAGAFSSPVKVTIMN